MALSLEDLRGRMLDMDTHLQLPPAMVAELQGTGHNEAFAAGRTAETGGVTETETRHRRGRQRLGRLLRTMTPPPDASPEEAVWWQKMQRAPGAYNADERLKAMDLMGVSRQLLFPSGFWPSLWSGSMEARAACSRYNDFALEWAACDQVRLVPTMLLNLHDVGGALDEAERCIGAGARAFVFACSQPPAGLSPGAPDWDSLWARMAEAGVVGLFHIGAEHGFVDGRWDPPPRDGDVPARGFDYKRAFAAQAFIGALIEAGVFDRNPALRWGVAEMSARWVGPWVDGMENAFGAAHRRKWNTSIADVVRRSIRVAPFHQERVGEYIERWGLAEVYAFSTDYPHPEGGVDPVGRFLASLAPLGDDITSAFFTSNAMELFPR